MADDAWRAAVIAAAELPSDTGSFAIRYVGLFRAKGRRLSPERSARLIRETVEMIVAGTEFNRTELKAPSHVWRDAIIEVLDSPSIKRPLTSHNYLKAVVTGLIGKRVDAQQAEQHQSRRGETRVAGGMKSIGDIYQPEIPVPKVPKQELPDIPAGERDAWMEKARSSLINEGFKAQYLIAPLLEQKAREMYAAENGCAAG